MDEDKTFNQLRRIPLEELIERLKGVKAGSFPPCPFSVSQNTAKYRLNYDIAMYAKRMQVIEDSGWTIDELDKEIERLAVMDWVDEFNQNISIPNEVLDAARRHFPNVKFIPARIELE